MEYTADGMSYTFRIDGKDYPSRRLVAGGSGIHVSTTIFQPPSACFRHTLADLKIISETLPFLSLPVTFPVPQL